VVQLRAFAPLTGWRPPELSTLPPWRGAARVAIDIETRDPDLRKLGPGVRRGAYVVGISFALARRPDPEKAESFYLPIRHEGGGNLDRGAVLSYLREQAREYRGEIVGANLQYDLDFLLELGIEFRPSFFRDVQLAEPLLDELQYSYSLDAVAERNGLPGKDQEMLERAARHFGVETKAGLWRLPAQHVGPYAEQDARLPLRILASQERRIRAIDSGDPRVQEGRARSLWSLWDLESRLLPVLLRMRRRGVRVDIGHLDVVDARCVREEEDSAAAFAAAVAMPLTPRDLGKTQLMGPILEQVTGLKFARTAKKQVPRVDAKFLRGLRHPTVDLYLRARRFSKLRTTFVEGIREHQVRGRVHTTFNQLRRGSEEEDDESGTISGRLSSCDPNLQQQPTKDPEIGPLWRAIYLPEDGEDWITCDLSNQEPRWHVHFAAETGCTGAAELRELYHLNHRLDLYALMRDKIGWSGDEGRDRTKIIYLGLGYGMGGPKLARALGLPTKWIQARSGRWIEVAGDEAQAVMDDFFHGAPFIRELDAKAQEVANANGFVRTTLGRRLHFPRPQSGAPGYDWLHTAVNKIVQGSSADQVKKAMVDADAAGHPLLLQVHDELDESGDERRARNLAEVMLSAVPCTVPHLVKPELGPDWGHTEPI
jgi:DNA polymerase I-like protein with 3'-5' exonuclease and polymerase domains